MAKGDDVVRRKQNKKNRKKQQMDSSKVSNRVAALIAAKKRRKSGKRRICQGMCFSLPTPEDPFNDRHGKTDSKRKEIKKSVPSRVDKKLSSIKNGAAPRKRALGSNHTNIDNQEEKRVKVKDLGKTISFESMDNGLKKNTINLGKVNIQLKGKSWVSSALQGHTFDIPGCPSKFLILCLNTIQSALRHDEAFSIEEDRPLFVDQWGIEFWKHYSVGSYILETSGSCSKTEQIAWMASTAADTITNKEKEGLSFTSPFLLFLVPSQEKAAKVRSICKPLKNLGIHTVSLHPGASLDHQIQGLQNCEPEVLVSTPERLLELLSLKAVDISGVSLLVVDGTETLLRGGCTDVITSIRQSISGNPQTVVFNDCWSHTSTLVVQNLMRQPIHRLSTDNSIASQSACIIQSVDVCVSEEERLSKAIELLGHANGNQLGAQLFKVLFLVGKNSKIHELASVITSKGYSVSTDLNRCKTEVEISTFQPLVSLLVWEQVSTEDISEFEVVIIFNFVHSVDNYVEILTRMARRSAYGMLHSLLSSEDAVLAGPLVEVLEQCGQEVPNTLRNLYRSSHMSEH